MRKQNFQSDFDFTLNLIDGNGVNVGWIDYNWELELFTTSRDISFTASHQYGENTNCTDVDGAINVAVDAHKFPVGVLNYKLTVDIPDEKFADGARKVVVEGETDIEIVAEPGQTMTDYTLDIKVPHLVKPVEEPSKDLDDK